MQFLALRILARELFARPVDPRGYLQLYIRAITSAICTDIVPIRGLRPRITDLWIPRLSREYPAIAPFSLAYDCLCEYLAWRVFSPTDIGRTLYNAYNADSSHRRYMTHADITRYSIVFCHADVSPWWRISCWALDSGLVLGLVRYIPLDYCVASLLVHMAELLT